MLQKIRSKNWRQLIGAFSLMLTLIATRDQCWLLVHEPEMPDSVRKLKAMRKAQ